MQKDKKRKLVFFFELAIIFLATPQRRKENLIERAAVE
jgi:hypothetical protein